MARKTRQKKYPDLIILDIYREKRNWISKTVFLASLGIVPKWPQVELKINVQPLLEKRKGGKIKEKVK